MAVDLVEVDPFPGQKQGREGLKQVISLAHLAPPFPTSIGVIEEMLGEGEKVFSRFTWHGTQRCEFFGVPATGKQITVKGHGCRSRGRQDGRESNPSCGEGFGA